VVHWIGAGKARDFDEDIIRWHLGEFRETNACELPTGVIQRIQQVCQDSFPTAVDQMSRNPACIGASLSDYRALYRFLIQRFTELLISKKVDQIFFQNLPHEGFEFVLYQVARALKVESVMTYQSILPNRFFYCRDLDDFGHFLTATPLGSRQSLRIERKFEKDLFYVKLHSGHNVRSATMWVNQARERMKANARFFTRWVKRSSGYDRIRQKTNRPLDPNTEYNLSLTKQAKKTVKYSRPFVYFPLHLQPELTTSAIGDRYSDQLLALERLRRFLPDSWWIYVKENPKQTFRQRDTGFFQRLANLPKTTLVDQKVDTYTLLQHCMFSATISGTVGWESITGGKSVLVFGRPWYLGLPGVFDIESCPSPEIIAAAHYSTAHLQLEFDRLFQVSREGIVDVAYRRAHAEFDEEKNAGLIADFVCEQLTSEPTRQCA
jgi:hypothetical protein